MVLFEQSSDMASFIINYDMDATARGEYFVRVFNELSRIYNFSYSALETVLLAIQHGNNPVDVFYQSDYPPARLDFSFFTEKNGLPLIDQSGRSYQWYNLHKNIIIPNNFTDNQVASLYRVFGHRESRSRYFIMFNFKNSFFREIFGEIQAAGNGYLALLGDGVIMHFNEDKHFMIDSSVIEKIENSQKDSGYIPSFSVDGKRVLIVWETLQLGRWKLAAIVPESGLVRHVTNITVITIISSFLAIGFALMLSLLVIRLVKLLEEEQKKKQDIRILHEQIKPHFLYNALNSIEQLGAMGENEKMIGSIKALTGFYRLGLSKGRQLIQLKDEITHAEYYLNIQMMQSEKLSYKINIDPEFMCYNIPKLTIQPILENAIIHGIKHGERLNMQVSVETVSAETVLAEKNGKDLKIKITDNGIGIPDDKLEAFSQAFKNDDWSLLPKAYGLRNVHERIRLYYGFPYGVSITSIFEEGTTVGILFPAEKSETQAEIP
jgi:two-component system sensor histidine kinase YesM